eukprot:scaffold1679_cov127-Isochrysis_galbana.AAC.8
MRRTQVSPCRRAVLSARSSINPALRLLSIAPGWHHNIERASVRSRHDRTARRCCTPRPAADWSLEKHRVPVIRLGLPRNSTTQPSVDGPRGGLAYRCPE